MAKRFLIVLAVLAVAGGAAFAAGQNEQAGGAFQGDKLVLKGTVSFQGLPHPILKSGDKQYLLMVPPYLVYQSGVKDGAQVSVQGYQMRYAPRFGWTGSDKSLIGLFVTQATVGGKDYDLSRYYGAWAMGGRGRGFGPGHGYGMMGRGYGPGRGMMGGGYGPGYGMMGDGYGPGRGYGPGMMDWGDGDDQ